MKVAAPEAEVMPPEQRRADSPLRSKRVSVVVGGTLSEDTRRAVRERRRPRIDVLEMESRWGASVFDFDRLHRDAASDRRARAILGMARKGGLWSPWLAYYALQHVRDDDMVYATGEDVGVPLAILMRLLRIRRPRLFVRLEQPTYGRNMMRRFAFDAYMGTAVKRIDKVICRTAAHAHYLNSVWKVPQRQLALAHETTDAAFFRPDEAPGGKLSGLAQPYIVSAGLEMRDYPTLIQAVDGLPVQTIIAAGSPWSHFSFGHEERLPPNVRVSSFSPEQLRDMYRRARFTVVPVKPTMRACGMNVVLESWAMSTAVVASRTTGLMDYGSDNETVLFANPGDVDHMRAKIRYLLNHPEEAKRLGLNGRRRVEDDLNLDRYLSRIEGLLLSGVAG